MNWKKLLGILKISKDWGKGQMQKICPTFESETGQKEKIDLQQPDFKKIYLNWMSNSMQKEENGSLMQTQCYDNEINSCLFLSSSSFVQLWEGNSPKKFVNELFILSFTLLGLNTLG